MTIDWGSIKVQTIEIDDGLIIQVSPLSGIVDIFSEESKELVEVDGDDRFIGGVMLSIEDLEYILSYATMIREVAISHKNLIKEVKKL